MISQAIIIESSKLLMVKQYVKRGDIVWNFPGGGIEVGETPEKAAIREVKEETGYDIILEKLLFHKENKKYTFIGRIIGGKLHVDKTLEGNDDIIEADWISLDDREKIDEVVEEMLEKYKKDLD